MRQSLKLTRKPAAVHIRCFFYTCRPFSWLFNWQQRLPHLSVLPSRLTSVIRSNRAHSFDSGTPVTTPCLRSHSGPCTLHVDCGDALSTVFLRGSTINTPFAFVSNNWIPPLQQVCWDHGSHGVRLKTWASQHNAQLSVLKYPSAAQMQRFSVCQSKMQHQQGKPFGLDLSVHESDRPAPHLDPFPSLPCSGQLFTS